MSRHSRFRLSAVFGPDLRIWIVLAVLVVAASFVYPNFVSTRNLSNIVTQAVPLALLAAGVAFVLLTAEIDLSVGAQVSFVSVIVANVMGPATELLVPVLLLVLLFGAGVGAVNGLLTTKARIPSFIVTLAMLLILQSLNLVWTAGGPASDITSVLTSFPRLKFFGIPVGLPILVVAVVGGWFVLKRTRLGRDVALVGSNARACRVAGLRVDRVRIFAFMIAGVMAACAGTFLTAYVGSGQSWLGAGMELSAITAAVVGGFDLFGGRGTVSGAVGGALLLSAVFNLLIVAGVPAAYNPVVTGALLMLGIAANLVTDPQSRLGAAVARWRHGIFAMAGR
ncbi:MAG TPA: ABC transporter permease [Bauldia sp.]|nr:ABC transporter permease [Bauldia sp.]